MWTERCSILESSQQALTSREKEPCPGLSLPQFPILHNACCPQDSTDPQPHLKREPTGVTSLNCQHLPIPGKAAKELWTRCLLSPSRVVNRGGFAGVLSISTVSSPQATQSSAYATNSPGHPGRGNPQPKEHFTQQIQNTHLLPRTLTTSQQHDNCCMFHPKLPC